MKGWVFVIAIILFCSPVYAHQPHNPILGVELSPNFSSDETLFAILDQHGILFKSVDGRKTFYPPTDPFTSKYPQIIRFVPTYSAGMTQAKQPKVNVILIPETVKRELIPLPPFSISDVNLSPPQRALSTIKSLGVEWFRFRIEWGQVEPKRGEFRWKKLDRILTLANKNGLGVYLRVIFKNPWAVKSTKGASRSAGAPPKDIQDFERFIYEMIRHSKGKARVIWAIGTEMNETFWRGSIEEYLASLKVAYKAAKRANPDALVATCAISGYEGYILQDLILSGQTEEALIQLKKLKKFKTKKGKFMGRTMSLPSTLDGLKVFLKKKSREIAYFEKLAKSLLNPEIAKYYDILTVHGATQIVDVPYFFGWFKKEMNKLGYDKMIYTEIGAGPPQMYDNPESIENWRGEDIPKLYSMALENGGKIISFGPLGRKSKPIYAPGKGRGMSYYLRYAGLLEEDFFPRPAFHSYKRMTDMLRGSTAIETLSSGPEAWVYKFIKGNDEIYVAWSEQGAKVKINLKPGKVVIINAVSGKSAQHEVQKDGMILNLGTIPVYIRSEH